MDKRRITEKEEGIYTVESTPRHQGYFEPSSLYQKKKRKKDGSAASDSRDSDTRRDDSGTQR